MNGMDDEALRQVLASYEAAWKMHDMRALAPLFRDDAVWVNVVGMYWRGKDAVVRAHAAFHETIFKHCELDSTNSPFAGSVLMHPSPSGRPGKPPSPRRAEPCTRRRERV